MTEAKTALVKILSLPGLYRPIHPTDGALEAGIAVLDTLQLYNYDHGRNILNEYYSYMSCLEPPLYALLGYF